MARIYKGSLIGGVEDEPGRLPGTTLNGWRVSEIAGVAGAVFLIVLMVYAGYEIVNYAWR